MVIVFYSCGLKTYFAFASFFSRAQNKLEDRKILTPTFIVHRLQGSIITIHSLNPTFLNFPFQNTEAILFWTDTTIGVRNVIGSIEFLPSTLSSWLACSLFARACREQIARDESFVIEQGLAFETYSPSKALNKIFSSGFSYIRPSKTNSQQWRTNTQICENWKKTALRHSGSSLKIFEFENCKNLSPRWLVLFHTRPTN